MIEIPFAKMHGLGNCFVLVDDTRGELSGAGDPSALARAVCDRDFGIGADGLVLVRRSGRADLEMRIINEDGSTAEMCGNGIRCFACFVHTRGITEKRALSVETLAGIVRTWLLDDGRVRVDMGKPAFKTEDVVSDASAPVRVEALGRAFTFVSMGNPHAVTFVGDFDFDWRAEGAQVEKASHFPNRINAHFARVLSPKEAEVKVWERGCGETKACGTGACAVAVAGVLEGRLPREPVVIRLPGGPLEIHWREDDHVMMTGPAVEVCRGEYLYRYCPSIERS